MFYRFAAFCAERVGGGLYSLYSKWDNERLDACAMCNDSLMKMMLMLMMNVINCLSFILCCLLNDTQ